MIIKREFILSEENIKDAIKEFLFVVCKEEINA